MSPTQRHQVPASLHHHLLIQVLLVLVQLPPFLPGEGHGQQFECHQHLESQIEKATLALGLLDETIACCLDTGKGAKRPKAWITEHVYEPNSGLSLFVEAGASLGPSAPEPKRKTFSGGSYGRMMQVRTRPW